ncbi:YesL family protein [Companilactobacillus jidongensis]|uniref:YesL family protein n=1 Tax=Companilactobacillus jidongensis TaxID=2486006 RepID=UPI000F76DEF3|nr:DUF624 domain-containing protein [Companilactobacillus jidongensis]
MVSKSIQVLFIRIYTIIKLNLIFWVLAFAGGLVAGIGPSLLTVSELYYTNEFDYREITFNTAWSKFKTNFKKGNTIFWTFTAVEIFLSYSLYTSVQLHGLIFIVSDFVIIAMLLLAFCLFWYVMNIQSGFTINYLNSLKLAFAHFFYNFFDNVKEIFGLAIIIGVTYRYKGLILFASISAMILITHAIGKNWLKHVDEVYK